MFKFIASDFFEEVHMKDFVSTMVVATISLLLIDLLMTPLETCIASICVSAGPPRKDRLQKLEYA